MVIRLMTFTSPTHTGPSDGEIQRGKRDIEREERYREVQRGIERYREGREVFP